MTAHHFFAEDVSGDRVVLTGEDARHAVRVLRIRPGESITVSDGSGSVVEARVDEAEQKAVTAAVTGRTTVRRPAPRVVVFPALPKAGKLDLVVQKLTEIGVDAIRPWAAERSVVRWDASKAAAHGDRLRAIAREAAKQSKRAWLPLVTDPAVPSELPKATIVLDERARTMLSDALPGDGAEQIGLVIGPEGGITDAEVEAFVRQGGLPAGLGPQILRAETAAIVASALVLARYGRLG